MKLYATLDRINWVSTYRKFKFVMGAAFVYGLGYWSANITHQTVKQGEVESKLAYSENEAECIRERFESTKKTLDFTMKAIDEGWAQKNVVLRPKLPPCS